MGDAKLKATAARLIAKRGRNFSFFQSRPAESETTPWLGSPESGGPYVTKAVDLETTNSKPDSSDPAIKSIKRIYVQLPSEITDPRLLRGVEDSNDDSWWSVKSFSVVQPGETLILYELTLER